MDERLSKVDTSEGSFMILTKVRYLGLLNMPRSSVMPYGTGEFATTPGFQIHYNTSDSKVLDEWHELLVALIQKGLFDALSDGARVGWFPYPDDKRHLQQYVKRFV
jgi:hypothetical protein